MYKKLKNEFTGVLTGKGSAWGGSLIRPEATGYGCVYFIQAMLGTRGEDLRGKRVAVSGSGNVAQFAVEKLLQLGAKVVTLSDSAGTVVDENGIDEAKLAWVMELQKARRGRMREDCAAHAGSEFIDGQRPWAVACEVAVPCATENEISGADAETLLQNGCVCVAEGANMPSDPEAGAKVVDAGILFAHGKAAKRRRGGGSLLA